MLNQFRLRPNKAAFGVLTIMIAGLYCPILFSSKCQAQTQGASFSSRQRSETQRKFQLNPKKSLLSRLGPTPADILQKFRDAGMAPREHHLTTEERLIVAKAFAALPPLNQRVLKQHLRSISFLDNMPNNALTSTLNPTDSYALFHITFRAAILKQNLTQWLTEKERASFAKGDSPLSIVVVGGRLNAINYVLLHETTHVVDGSLDITPESRSGREITDSLAKNSFVTGIWLDRTTIAPQFGGHILDSTRYRRSGKVLPIDQAPAVYEALRKTPFASLYSTSSQHEDLAEYLALYHFTQKLKQPFKIIIYDKEKQIFTYEPMKSELVRSRFKYMQRFYSKAG